MEWIVTAATIVLVIIAAAVLAIVLRYGQRSGQPSGWTVEMWHLSCGYALRFAFANEITLGRDNLYNYVVDAYPVKIDVTVSRHHCMFYENNSRLFIWNMSAVNPVILNGQQITQPVMLQTGDRLELGNSVFLVTDIRCDRV